MIKSDYQTQCPYCDSEVQVYTGDREFVIPRWKAYIFCGHCGLQAPEVTASNQLEAISEALSVFNRILFKEAANE